MAAYTCWRGSGPESGSPAGQLHAAVDTRPLQRQPPEAGCALAPFLNGQYIQSMARSRGRRRESEWSRYRVVMTAVRTLLILASIIVLTEAIWSVLNQFHQRAYFLYSTGAIFAALGLLHLAFQLVAGGAWLAGVHPEHHGRPWVCWCNRHSNYRATGTLRPVTSATETPLPLGQQGHSDGRPDSNRRRQLGKLAFYQLNYARGGRNVASFTTLSMTDPRRWPDRRASGSRDFFTL